MGNLPLLVEFSKPRRNFHAATVEQRGPHFQKNPRAFRKTERYVPLSGKLRG
jgi:hypothetical protein